MEFILLNQLMQDNMLYSHILSLLILSIISAFIGFAFQRMMDADMIFEKYKDFLNYLANKKWYHYGYVRLNIKLSLNKYLPKWLRFDILNDTFVYDSSKYIKSKSTILYYITKPLGRCVICNTTWIGIILTLFYSNMEWRTILYCIIVGCTSAGLVVLIVNYYNMLQREY